MGPLLVVVDQPVVSDLLYLVDGLEHVGAEHFFAVGLVEPLDERILVRLARFGEAQRNAALFSPILEGVTGELVPIVQSQGFGLAV